MPQEHETTRPLSDVERRAIRTGPAWLDGATTRFEEEELLEAWAERLALRGRPGSPETLAVYLHFPYCRSHCRYCRYGTSILQGPEQHSAYLDYVISRLVRLRRQLGRVRASSLYLGGGTPSLLSVRDLSRLLAELQQTFDVAGDVTVEGHPGSLDRDKIAEAMRRGTNRFSLGVQTTDPLLLAALERHNPATHAIEAQVRAILEGAGVVNIDLMVGLPGQTWSMVDADLRWAIATGAQSITLYRYVDVDRLPSGPDRARFADLPWRRLIPFALRRGYLPIYDGSPDASAATFWHPPTSRRQLRRGVAARLWAVAHLARSLALHRPLPASARLMHFTGFDVPMVHTLGIGPGAISHLFGHAWYEDVSLGTDPELTGPPRLSGRPISLDGELKRAVAADLLAGRWVRSSAYLASVGRDPLGLFRGLSEGLTEALHLEPSRARLRLGHPAAPNLLRSMLSPG